MASRDNQYDIVIVGGGISGLYTAWRLASNTNYSIAVLEYSHRFGGRYRTCEMPGGFLADLGAMRYTPAYQPLLHKLIADMNLETEPFFSADSKMSRVFYVRNKFCKNMEEVKMVYGIREEDEKYLLTGSITQTQLPTNGNYFRATLRGTTTLAKNITLRQFWSGSMNSGVMEYQSIEAVGSRTLSEDCGVKRPYACSTNNKSLTYNCMRSIKSGAESLTRALVCQLESLGVTLLKGHAVTRIQELNSLRNKQYNVKVECSDRVIWFSSMKIILACNARGLETITWESEFDRIRDIQRLLGKINKICTVKAALTYRRAWWEDKNVECGSLVSDLPISKISIMGERAKKNGFATIYMSSFNRSEVFEGLNNDDEERYQCSEGNVPHDLLPSQAVVESVQKQLKAAFDGVEIPDPVSACISTWSSDPIGYCWYAPKVGVDHHSLYWKSLKPFGEGEEVYIIGDVFSAVTPEAVYTSYSEGALLTSERVLYKYFHLGPYEDNLHLDNPWPKDST